MIKLKAGQRVIDEKGNRYIIEKGDILREGTVPYDVLDGILYKYEDKDYFEDDAIIKGKIEQWKSMGEPAPWTPSSIEDTMRDNFHNERVEWLQKVAQSIYDKDRKTLLSKVRYDQPLMQDLFLTVTGISLKGKSNKAIAEIIEDYVNS